jgi:hypothetical protein
MVILPVGSALVHSVMGLAADFSVYGLRDAVFIGSHFVL